MSRVEADARPSLFLRLALTSIVPPGTAALGAVSVCTARFGGAAASTSIRGQRATKQLPAGSFWGSTIAGPVVLSRSIKSSTLAVGDAWRRTAIAPATCGAAADVPLNTANGPDGNTRLGPANRE